MKQGFFSRLLLLNLLLLSALCISAHDIEVKNADGVTLYCNYYKGNQQLVVTYKGDSWKSNPERYTGNLVIPNTLNYDDKEYTIVAISDHVFYGCKNLTSVNINSSVSTLLGYTPGYRFYGCTSLKSVTLSGAMMEILESDFEGCSSLETLTIPEGIERIETNAFKNCSSLKNIQLPTTLTYYLGNGAFSGCTSLTYIKLPQGLKEIGEGAFRNCRNLTDFIIPEGNKISFDKAIFQGCKNIKELTFPSTVSSVNVHIFHDFADKLNTLVFNGGSIYYYDENDEYSAPSFPALTTLTIGKSVNRFDVSLSGCTKLSSMTVNCKSIDFVSLQPRNLKELTLGESVAKIEVVSYITCPSLETITVSSNNSYFKAIDGVLYNKSATSLVWYPYANPHEVWSTPSTLRSMYNFKNKFLKEIRFNGTMETVYIPAISSENIPYMKVVFKQSVAPAILGENNKDVWEFDVPKESWESYKNNIIPSENLDESIEFVNRLPRQVAIYEIEANRNVLKYVSELDPNYLVCFDEDKDGQMDWLRSEYESNSKHYNYRFYGLGGDEKKELMTHKQSFESGTILNSNEDFVLYSKSSGGGIYDCSLDGLTYDYLRDNNIMLIADIDNDGRKDIVEKYRYKDDDSFTIRYQQPDGSFVPTEQTATLDSTALKTPQGNYAGPGGVISFAVGMMIGGNGPAYFNVVEGIDMNNDGVLDMMDTKKGGVLYSYAPNKFFANPKKGVLYPCDLNGDSELDYIIYDGETISLQTRVSGTIIKEKNLFTNKNVKNIIYKDFDHDGDIDILAYINDSSSETKESGTTYFVFFRNNGDLSFKKIERNFTKNYWLYEVKDVDANGLYEILVYDGNDKVTKLLEISSDLSVSESSIDLSDRCRDLSYTYYPIVTGDFDNDGRVDYRYSTIYGKIGYDSKLGIKYGAFSDKENAAPQKMEVPTAVLNTETGRLRINWKQGKDTETSSCDLTYELRIGTKPASGDVLFGASLDDGTRRTIDEGNMGRNLYNLFNANSLKPGKYFISVQAIDGGGRGGAWSDDFVYEHKLMAPAIVSNYTNQMSTVDTLLLSVKSPVEGATYQWTVSDSRRIESGDGYAKYIFEHDGEHTINLAMTFEGRTLNSEHLTLLVSPAKKATYIGNYPGVVDLNQDGYPEVFGKYNDGTGKFNDVLLSYVTDIPQENDYSDRKRHYLDYNLDGFPDVIVKNNVYINTCEQDNDFEMFTQKFDRDGQTYIDTYHDNWFDANNDGYLDNDYCYNTGNNIVWKPYYTNDERALFYVGENQLLNEYRSNYGFLLGTPNYDVNRDGFLDIVKRSGERWYVMYKDSTVNISYTTPQVLFEVERPVSNSWMIEDINNDGYVDLIIYDSEQIQIVKGSSNLPCKEDIIYELPAPYNGNSSSRYSNPIRDYNNDGYLDIVCTDYSLSFSTDFTVKGYNYNGLIDSYSKFMLQNDEGRIDGSITNIKNQPPSAPATVAAKQTKDGLLITWSDAQDDHTPAMQMRYNISVKRKGKKGDNSFVISPMNGLIDKATICGSIMYKKSTQMLVPASVLTAGETYEIQVQAIDLWNQHSPMTKAIEFTMTSNGYIDMAEKVAIGKETTVKFVGTNANSYSLNAGTDGTIVKDEGNGQYIVKWSSEGLKEIALTAGAQTLKSSITVVKPVDLTFAVPSQVFAGAPLTISVSEEMAVEPNSVGMRVLNNDKVKVEYMAGSKTALVTFPEIGTYTLEAYSEDAIRGNSYTQVVDVIEVMPEAAIEKVDVDGSTGCYAIYWNTTSLPAAIQKVVILKEGKSLNQFNIVETVEASDGRYIDSSSTPEMVSTRYRIQFLSDGQASELSTPHKPLHVMMVKATKGYNLIWDKYEGMNVASYNILRGSSPDKMEQIAQVAGSICSYTDVSAPNETAYYAVTFSSQQTNATHRSSASNEVSSNIISTQDAIDIVAAQHLEIILLDEDKTLSKTHQELQLYSLLLPTYTTITKVNWEIIEGSDIATIDANGLLRATGGEGTVTVRLSTIDGSDLSAEISIPSSYSIIEPSVITVKSYSREYGEGNNMSFPADVYTLQGQKVRSKTMTLEGLPKGIYVVKGRKIYVK